MISPSQRPLPDNTQHSQQTNIHAPGGIRTHNRSRWAAINLHLRPRGYWDRLFKSVIDIFNDDCTVSWWDYIHFIVHKWMNELINSFIKQYEALVEWQHTSKVLKVNPVPVSFCPPKTQCGVACIQTSANTVRGWQLNAWAMTKPNFTILTKFGKIQTMKLLIMQLSGLLFCLS